MSGPASALHPAAGLEAVLGDPHDPDSVCSFASAVANDEAERFPEEAAALLARWGLDDYFIPVTVGGKLAAFDEASAIIRIVSRRDPSLAVAVGQCFLAAMPAWIAGTTAQQERVAALLRAHRPLAFAMTERAHGSDIMAGEVAAAEAGGRYELSGEKWLINNATRGEMLSVLARTDARGGPRGFSILLFEKSAAPPETYAHLPKIRTHGIRGADISGIRFRGAPAAGGMIGNPGDGVEVAVKTLMVTRSLCPAFSLGAADTALRIVLRFARERRLYGGTVFDIPAARAALADARADLRACEVLAEATARSIHVAPDQLSVASAVAKYFIPTTIEDVLRELSVILGARYYLREDYAHGMFQKLLRDAAVVSLFDGSTMVNLHALSMQIHALHSRRARAGEDDDLQPRLRVMFAHGAPLPLPDFSRLALLSRGRNDIVDGLPAATESLAGQSEASRLLRSLAGELLERIEEHDQAASALPRTPQRGSTQLFQLARQYCVLHAAAALVHATAVRHDGNDGDREVAALALHRLLRRLGPLPDVSARLSDAAFIAILDSGE